MYKCDICGREIKKKYYLSGYTLCKKHMNQLRSRGKFLDNCPRTQHDLNEFIINGRFTFGGLYNELTCEKIDEFIIDTEDLAKVKYHKWRLSHGQVVTGLKNSKRELSWVILGLDNRVEKNITIEHINGNLKDNRKSNLKVLWQ